MEKRFMKGNEAIAEAAVQAGCRYFFGYPITPQNEIPEYLSWRLPEVGGTFVQAESEVAAINMVYGAGGAGGRVMTSSSGPGISLKSEGISYIAGSNIPCVIVNIMRAGPGLGGIQSSQADYNQSTRGGGHGDYHCLVYTPSSVQQAVDLTQLAFDKADEYRMPVMVLGDGTIGQMMEPVVINERKPIETDRSWAAVGWNDKLRPRAVINSLSLDPVRLEKMNDVLQEKYKIIREKEVMYETYKADECDILVVAFGTTARTVRSVINEYPVDGYKIGLFCPLTVWPYPYRQLKEAAKGKKAILVAEMNAGQMIDDVRLAVEGSLPVHFYGRTGGIIPSAEEIFENIKKIVEVL